MWTPKCRACGFVGAPYRLTQFDVWLCRMCRQDMLRWFRDLGVQITSANPLINDLCSGSAFSEKESYRFWLRDGESFWVRPPGGAEPIDSQLYFDPELDILRDL